MKMKDNLALEYAERMSKLLDKFPTMDRVILLDFHYQAQKLTYELGEKLGKIKKK
jgi:hypothetical protein